MQAEPDGEPKALNKPEATALNKALSGGSAGAGTTYHPSLY